MQTLATVQGTRNRVRADWALQKMEVELSLQVREPAKPIRQGKAPEEPEMVKAAAPLEMERAQAQVVAPEVVRAQAAVRGRVRSQG